MIEIILALVLYSFISKLIARRDRCVEQRIEDLKTQLEELRNERMKEGYQQLKVALDYVDETIRANYKKNRPRQPKIENQILELEQRILSLEARIERMERK